MKKNKINNIRVAFLLIGFLLIGSTFITESLSYRAFIFLRLIGLIIIALGLYFKPTFPKQVD